MKEERPTFLREEDIENILSPRCDFHASPAVMERVMEEIEATSLPKPMHRPWWRYAGVAAAIAVIIVASILVSTKTENHPEAPLIASTLPVFDETIETDATNDIPEVKDESREELSEKEENPSLKNKIMNEKNVMLAENIESEMTHTEMQETDTDEISYDIQIQIAVEGPMSSRSDLAQSNSSKLLLSTDECDGYIRMVRQSYIDRVRFEIAETEAFVREMRESVTESI